MKELLQKVEIVQKVEVEVEKVEIVQKVDNVE